MLPVHFGMCCLAVDSVMISQAAVALGLNLGRRVYGTRRYVPGSAVAGNTGAGIGNLVDQVGNAAPYAR